MACFLKGIAPTLLPSPNTPRTIDALFPPPDNEKDALLITSFKTALNRLTHDFLDFFFPAPRTSALLKLTPFQTFYAGF